MWLKKTTGLSLQLIISIKATFFLLRKHVTAGGEATQGLCGEGLSAFTATQTLLATLSIQGALWKHTCHACRAPWQGSAASHPHDTAAEHWHKAQLVSETENALLVANVLNSLQLVSLILNLQPSSNPNIFANYHTSFPLNFWES